MRKRRFIVKASKDARMRSAISAGANPSAEYGDDDWYDYYTIEAENGPETEYIDTYRSRINGRPTRVRDVQEIARYDDWDSAFKFAKKYAADNPDIVVRIFGIRVDEDWEECEYTFND